ncbi:MAG: DUF433 domain-containing protein [Bacteroidetes bacterium]|nr:DUF433 domain-containing protein [Bacteroidota bacterium]
MNWRNHIQADPEVLVGKPAIKGTRLAVEFILGLYEAGWTEQQILDNYPRLTQDDLRAVFAYLQDCIKDELILIRA